MSPWFVPAWPVPRGVRALVTTRQGGVGAGGYAGFNLASHVGDEPSQVETNRALLRAAAQLPAEPVWLSQVHGTRCIDASLARGSAPEADAAFTSQRGVVCTILTADCLPILLCDRAGTCVAAVHAGWRGLADGVITSALARLPPAAELLAWIGPGIGPAHYQVGGELRARFLQADSSNASAFVARGAHWYADLPALAARQLELAGVGNVIQSRLCTFAEAERFYSFRREPVCGRFASLIWIA